MKPEELGLLRGRSTHGVLRALDSLGRLELGEVHLFGQGKRDFFGDQVGENRENTVLQEKFRRVILQGVRNHSLTPPEITV